MPPSDLLTQLKQKIRFTVQTQPYDADYVVGKDTRATTNFANFARNPADLRHSISLFLALVNGDLNRLLGHDQGDQRYAIRLEILSVRAHLDRDSVDQDPATDGILMTEVMRARVQDCSNGSIHAGPTGMNFSSYLRDYDFRIVLPALLQRHASPEEMEQFGLLHGLLSRLQFGRRGLISDPLAIAISISQMRLHRHRESPYPAGPGVHIQSHQHDRSLLRPDGLVPPVLPSGWLSGSDRLLCRRFTQ